MQDGTKRDRPVGRPREFDASEALGKMQRQLWTSGLSGASVEDIARAAGLNRPSLAAAFGDRDAIYTQTAAHYAAMMHDRLTQALSNQDLEAALTKAFDAIIDIYTAQGPDGCFILCTTPAEALTNPVCRRILDDALQSIDAMFLDRLTQDRRRRRGRHVDLSAPAALLGATLHSLALRARAGWRAPRLRTLARSMIEQVLATIGWRSRRRAR